MPAGSLFGALAVTQLADRIGRKRTVILAGMIWVIGSILQCAAVVRRQRFIHIDSVPKIYGPESRHACGRTPHLGYLRWAFQRSRTYIPIGDHCTCYSGSYGFVATMVGCWIGSLVCFSIPK